jgi:glycosyltransferase involved in cell wall biosynthesis
MRLRVGIDARMAGHSGIGTYVRGLLDGLAADARHDYVLFAAAEHAGELPGGGRFEVRTTRVPAYAPGEHTTWRRELLAARCDLYHVPHYNAPLGFPAPFVVTIHDLLHLAHPELMRSRLRAAWARLLVRGSVRRAAALIAVSETTRAELERRLEVEPRRITVIVEGVAARFAPPDPPAVAAFRARRGLTAPFVLCVGLLRPHKNVVRLVQAYDRARTRLGDDVHLVLWGRRDRRYPEIEREIAARRLETRVHIVEERLSDADMPLLYAAARAFVLPSLHEGFGLPPLEAMACGTPVLAARAGALPEILGEAALLVAPEDVAALAGGLERVVRDGELRRDLRARGLERARLYTWSRAAHRTQELYERVAAPA